MGTLRHSLMILGIAAALAACTPGAISAPGGNVAATGMVVGESLFKYAQTSSKFGPVGGFNPTVIDVASGTVLQFHNEDSFPHTASAIGTSGFPTGNPLTITAEMKSGTDVSQAGWSSGVLLANSFSQPLSTSHVGTFYFGCFYHYPLMRGVIVVQ
jgi:plastocyanin